MSRGREGVVFPEDFLCAEEEDALPGDALPEEVRWVEGGEGLTEEERRCLCDGEGGTAPPK